MKISFIAPVYKVEKYLADFFNSFYNVKNLFEIILVNDDPTVNLEVWKKKYPNFDIKIINNDKNVGIRMSRINGLKNISQDSTHVIFIDPDDRLSADIPAFEQIVLPTQFAFNLWFKNKLIYNSPDGDISKYLLDNHLWGIIFPKEIAIEIPRFSNENEIDDMPIKFRMAEKYIFCKKDIAIIDYRIRKGSAANGKKSERSAHEQITTWRNLFENDHLIDRKKSIDNQYFELVINKQSFEKTWYKNKYNELSSEVSFLTKFNAHMYRLVSWWALQNKLKSIFLNRKMFD